MTLDKDSIINSQFIFLPEDDFIAPRINMIDNFEGYRKTEIYENPDNVKIEKYIPKPHVNTFQF